MKTLLHKIFEATKWLNVIFLRRDSLNPNSACKSVEIKETQQRVPKTNEGLIFVHNFVVERGTWVQQRFPSWKL